MGHLSQNPAKRDSLIPVKEVLGSAALQRAHGDVVALGLEKSLGQKASNERRRYVGESFQSVWGRFQSVGAASWRFIKAVAEPYVVEEIFPELFTN